MTQFQILSQDTLCGTWEGGLCYNLDWKWGKIQVDDIFLVSELFILQKLFPVLQMS